MLSMLHDVPFFFLFPVIIHAALLTTVIANSTTGHYRILIGSHILQAPTTVIFEITFGTY